MPLSCVNLVCLETMNTKPLQAVHVVISLQIPFLPAPNFLSIFSEHDGAISNRPSIPLWDRFVTKRKASASQIQHIYIFNLCQCAVAAAVSPTLWSRSDYEYIPIVVNDNKEYLIDANIMLNDTKEGVLIKTFLSLRSRREIFWVERIVPSVYVMKTVLDWTNK